MNFLKDFVNLIFYGNFWIAICALAMVLQTQYLLDNGPLPTALSGLLFFATLFLYALHRIVGIERLKDFFGRGTLFRYLPLSQTHPALRRPGISGNALLLFPGLLGHPPGIADPRFVFPGLRLAGTHRAAAAAGHSPPENIPNRYRLGLGNGKIAHDRSRQKLPGPFPGADDPRAGSVYFCHHPAL